MKKRPPGIVLAGAVKVESDKNRQTDFELPAPQLQAPFQSIGALSQAVIDDLIRRRVSELLEA